MDGDSTAQDRLTQAWDEAAVGYEEYFVPRFAPWVAAAVSALGADPLPAGPIVVPCCGTFPELPALVAGHPDREVVGIDLSGVMAALARERATAWPQVRVVTGDATDLASHGLGGSAAVVSVFGLQQLPDPAGAIDNWVRTLGPGGRLSVMYWPAVAQTEGPFALLNQLLAEGDSPGEEDRSEDLWEDRLAAVAAEAGANVERDELVTFPMEHSDKEAFWTAMTTSGPMRATAIARGPEFMDALERRFLAAAPSGPLRHAVTARHLVARRGAESGSAPA